MKKVLPLLALIVVGVLVYLHQNRAGHAVRATELVPENTLVFAHFPDLERTRERWKSTALCELLAEPEVQVFLEKPRAKAPFVIALEEQLRKIERIGVKEAFFAVTSLEGAQPQMVAGLSYSGSRSQVDALLEQPRAALLKRHPAGSSDLVTYGAAEIEVFTDKGITVAATFRDNWFLLANDLHALQETLDRLDLKTQVPGLGQSALFSQATRPVPGDRDALFFVRVDVLRERLGSLLAASGQPAALKDLEKIQAITATTKLDGAQFRDTIFVLSPGAEPEPVLPRHALALTSASTQLYFSLLLPKEFDVPESSLQIASRMVPGFADLQKALSDHGLKGEDFARAFGPELGVVLDWPQSALRPSLLLALDVRDAEKADLFAKAFASPDWAKDPQAEQSVPALSGDGKFLLFGLGRGGGPSALEPSPKLTLAVSPNFSRVSITAPTSAYGYVDLRAMFERSYGTFRPLLIMSLAFSPSVGRYVDGGKLPGPDVIAKHLHPLVISQGSCEQGFILESTGTVTLNQALLGIGSGTLVMALPDLLKTIRSQGLNPSDLNFSPSPSPQTP